MGAMCGVPYKIGRAWGILAIKSSCLLLRWPNWHAERAQFPTLRNKGPVGSKNPPCMPAVESRLGPKAKVSSPHWKVDCMQLFQIQSLLFVHTQNTFVNAPQSA